MKKAIKTVDETLAYLKQGMNSFISDPPDSDFQRGYLAALMETKRFVTDDYISRHPV